MSAFDLARVTVRCAAAAPADVARRCIEQIALECYETQIAGGSAASDNGGGGGAAATNAVAAATECCMCGGGSASARAIDCAANSTHLLQDVCSFAAGAANDCASLLLWARYHATALCAVALLLCVLASVAALMRRRICEYALHRLGLKRARDFV